MLQCLLETGREYPEHERIFIRCPENEFHFPREDEQTYRQSLAHIVKLGKPQTPASEAIRGSLAPFPEASAS